MEGEQFSLCWNNFHSNLSNGFNLLLKDEDLVDVTLAAEGKFMKAHKTVLSVCSPFFKELFRANPSKHPIVILPEVNYKALCNLLQFMYQGEVSVSQEEIPTFMRVAEMLKVKGLTEDPRSKSPLSEKNDSDSSNKNVFTEPKQIMKRTRPVKKIIKPIQPLRPLEPPKPLSPPLKKPHLEDTSLHKEHLPYVDIAIKPKEEVSEDLEDTSNTFNDSDSAGMPHIADIDMGQSSNDWQPTDLSKNSDTSTPGTLQCIIGRRGNPRLIVDGYVFYKKSVYKGKGFWYCKLSRAPEKCQAVCWTLNGNIVKWPHMHTHPPIPDIFNPEEDTEVPIENLQEVLWQSTI